DVMGVPTLIMARTDADSAHLITSDIDQRDREFLTGERTPEGFFKIRGGLRSAKLGAHVREVAGVRGVHFGVWAPNARRVSVVGNFNMWDGRVHPMRHRGSSGIWEIV